MRKLHERYFKYSFNVPIWLDYYINAFAVQKERGPEKVISRMTLISGILFFAIVIALQVI